jgi:chromosome partitioning protein
MAMDRDGRILAVAGARGGTGRTTLALALAWILKGDDPVTLVDADPTRAASLILGEGEPAWDGVHYAVEVPTDTGSTSGLVVVDCPPLGSSSSVEILSACDAVVLTCRADGDALRGVAAAARAVEAVRRRNPHLELLGVAVGQFDPRDRAQREVVTDLRRHHGELLLDPPVPLCPAVRDWPLRPGTGLPEGPAADAYRAIARTLEAWVRPAARV